VPLLQAATVAAGKGDRLPQQAMGKLLESIGRKAPLMAEEAETAERLREAGAFVCRRTGRPGTKMASPPPRAHERLLGSMPPLKECTQRTMQPMS
jgi:hypothetical protein